MIMSYINEALQKAQKENESSYAAYGHIIGVAPGKARRPARRMLLGGILILAGLIAFTVALLYGLADKKEFTTKQRSVLVTTRQLPPAATGTAAQQGSLSLPAATIPAAIALQPAPATPVVLPTPPQSLPDNTAKTVAVMPQQAKEEPSSPPPAEVMQANIDYATLFARALKKQNEGKLMEAKELYRKVIKNDPRNVQALNNIGVIYMSEKNYRRATLRFNDALTIKPDYADVHYNLACLYSQTKDVARSFRHLQTAIGINPEVRLWAKKDRDLQELSKSPDFHNLLEEPENQ
jgi:tetratricopeptide (TPR) repeat protein